MPAPKKPDRKVTYSMSMRPSIARRLDDVLSRPDHAETNRSSLIEGLIQIYLADVEQQTDRCEGSPADGKN